MANVVIQLDPIAARLPATLAATLTAVAAATVGTNPSFVGYVFDGAGTSKNYINLEFRSSNYASGNVTVDIDWWATGSATTGTVKWEAALCVVTPGDATNVTTDSFATANTTTTTTSTTSKGMVRTTITITNLDSLAAEDRVILQIDRDPANDTCTDGVMVDLVTVSYLSL